MSWVSRGPESLGTTTVSICERAPTRHAQNGHARHASDCHMEPQRLPALTGTPCPLDRMDSQCGCKDGTSGPLCRCSPPQRFNATTKLCKGEQEQVSTQEGAIPSTRITSTEIACPRPTCALPFNDSKIYSYGSTARSPLQNGTTQPTPCQSPLCERAAALQGR